MTERQARAEEVPPGYKRTEVGVVPNGWQAVKLGSLTIVVRGASPRPIDNPKWFDERSSTGWLRISDVTATCKYVTETTQSLSPAGIANSRFVKSGNLVMSICATVGRPVITRKDVCIHDGFVVFDNLRADIEYLYYVLSDIEDDWSKYGQTGSQMNLNTNLIRATPIPIPPLPEQRAIATALSDADRLIGALGALIEKKRAIKQGAMQQLLTGKKRLPGFEGEWETKRLGEIGTFSKGRGIKRDDVTDDGLLCIRYGELYTRYHNYVTTPVSRISPTVAQTALPIQTGDLLFAGSGETAEEIGRCAAYLGNEQAYVGGDTIVLTPSGQDSMYLGHLMNHPLVATQKARFGQGDAIVHISAQNLARVKIVLPPIEEQRAIATVLSDMDAEITALERRREKAKQIKRGMMQQLLTGRIRLVEPPEAAA